MIGHFIAQDFRATRFYWAFVGGFTAIAAIGVLGFGKWEALLILIPIYFYLWLMQLQMLVGFKWRSQQQMSRNYYLALPVNRKRLFLFIQGRAFALGAPLVLLLVLIPFLNLVLPSPSLPLRRFWSSPSFPLIAYCGMFWMQNQMLSGALQVERISGYLTVQQRTWEYVKWTGSYLVETMVLIGAFQGFSYFGPGPILAVLSAMAAFRFFRTRKLWIGV